MFEQHAIYALANDPDRVVFDADLLDARAHRIGN